MIIELDYMEYSSDGTAQAAYVSSDTTTTAVVTQSQTGTSTEFALSTSEDGAAQGIKVSTSGNISKFTLRLRKQAASDGTLTAYIYSDDGSGNPNASLATFSNMLVSDLTTSYVDYEFTGNYTPVVGTQYHIVLLRTGATTGNWYISGETNGYADGNGTYHDGSGWHTYASIDLYFKVYQDSPHLQCYSESTIKAQGTYSLKVSALVTDSLNDTLTRTIGSPINLSNVQSVPFYIYSNRTGSNIKIGFHDSGGTTTESTPNVLSTSSWQKVTVNFSNVSNANKDAIDQIIVTIANADATNTFYLDDIYGIIPLPPVIFVGDD